MKILSSSPYATFTAKDWNLSINSSNSINPSSRVRVKKLYFKNYVKSEIPVSLNGNPQGSEEIQLSFA